MALRTQSETSHTTTPTGLDILCCGPTHLSLTSKNTTSLSIVPNSYSVIASLLLLTAHWRISFFVCNSLVTITLQPTCTSFFCFPTWSHRVFETLILASYKGFYYYHSTTLALRVHTTIEVSASRFHTVISHNHST